MPWDGSSMAPVFRRLAPGADSLGNPARDETHRVGFQPGRRHPMNGGVLERRRCPFKQTAFEGVHRHAEMGIGVANLSDARPDRHAHTELFPELSPQTIPNAFACATLAPGKFPQ